MAEEPGAGKLHAGICAGAVRQLAVLPRWFLEPTALAETVIQRIGPSASALYMANADGSGERQLFTMSALDYNAALSLDGQWIVFTSERAGSANPYHARVDGSALERLTDDPA
jgi:hypothetical protein